LILFFMVVAVLISTLVAQALLLTRAGDAGLRTQFAVLVGYAIVAGLAALVSIAVVVGGYGPEVWASAGLVAFASAATGSVLAGAARLLGAPGLGLAALVVVLLDLVASGGPVGSELLPDFYRWLAPWMPAGQLYSALRGSLFFGGMGLGPSALVLSGWLGVGLLLTLLGELARRRGRAVERINGAPA
jgi:hypothetical protein